jgi:hypothetical protein
MRTSYGIDIAAPGMPLGELADHVMWLPAGCPLWQSMGGPASVTMEAELLRWIDYRLRVLAWQNTKDAKDGRNPPAPPAPLRFKGEVDEVAARAAAKGSAWARRQALRAAAAAPE